MLIENELSKDKDKDKDKEARGGWSPGQKPSPTIGELASARQLHAKAHKRTLDRCERFSLENAENLRILCIYIYIYIHSTQLRKQVQPLADECVYVYM